MTSDEFMQWYETQEGKWELHDGVPVRKHDPEKGQMERVGHGRAKHTITRLLEDAIAKTGHKCEVLPDGMSVEINDDIRYEPDALVYCGERMDGKSLFVPNPVIIVEVLSPSTAWKDVSAKLADYFTLETVMHYLVIDPARHTVMHHYRAGDDIKARAVVGESLELDPPGLVLDMKQLFPDRA